MLSNRPKQMVYDGLTNEAYRALTQSFQLTNLDDIQTKGARYTSRKHLPKAANDQEYVKSTPSTRGMILRESGKIQVLTYNFDHRRSMVYCKHINMGIQI